MTEQQEYRVLNSHGNVELREYAPCVVADVVTSGSAGQAGSAAFRPLFEYISGANRGAEPLAMTAPVIQKPASERLAMTAPVLQEPAGANEWTVLVARIVPGYLQRPTAMAIFVLAVPIALALPGPAGWSWLPPILLAKLLVAHAVHEEAYRP